MADDELEKLRAQRMAELRSQYKSLVDDDDVGSDDNRVENRLLSSGGGDRLGEGKEKEEAMQREHEMKNSILSQILDQDARARLNSIALVKPDKARMVESMLIQMAQTGQLQGKLGEPQLVNLLERVNEQTKKTTTVKFDRRRHALGSDEDDD